MPDEKSAQRIVELETKLLQAMSELNKYQDGLNNDYEMKNLSKMDLETERRNARRFRCHRNKVMHEVVIETDE